MKDAFTTIRHFSLTWAEPDESNSRSHVSTTPRSFKVFLTISQPTPCMHISFSTHSQNNFRPWIYYPTNTDIMFIEWKKCSSY